MRKLLGYDDYTPSRLVLPRVYLLERLSLLIYLMVLFGDQVPAHGKQGVDVFRDGCGQLSQLPFQWFYLQYTWQARHYKGCKWHTNINSLATGFYMLSSMFAIGQMFSNEQVEFHQRCKMLRFLGVLAYVGLTEFSHYLLSKNNPGNQLDKSQVVMSSALAMYAMVQLFADSSFTSVVKPALLLVLIAATVSNTITNLHHVGTDLPVQHEINRVLRGR